MYLKSLIIIFLLNTFSLFAESVGDASWYGKEFQGKPTASGDSFDMYAYTAAHRTLPFGTMLKVTNLSNNKSIIVRVNDRGPFKENRIVDLSYQAAKEIGMLIDGTAEVSIVEIKTNENDSNQSTSKLSENNNPYLTDEEYELMQNYTTKMKAPKTAYKSKNEYKEKILETKSAKLQIAAFSSKKNAEKFLNNEDDNGFKMEITEVYLEAKQRKLFKVLIVCASEDIASNIISSKKYAGAYRFITN